MAEAVVGVVVEQLVSIAAGWLQKEISLLKGVKTKLENMKNKMQFIQTVVEDAENQSVKKKIVKLWLKKLQDVSYDMDDVLDEWSTRVHKLEREEAEEHNTSDEIVGSSSSSPTTCFSMKKLNCFSSVKQLPWRREIALRIKDINERINSVFSEMKDFKLASKAVGNDGLDKTINIARTTTSFVDESKVYGRDDDKDFLLSKVLSANAENENSPQVISIVGAGGLGKTTLAQMVYNDEKVKEKFGDRRIWVCVSDPFDEVKVAKDILEGLKVGHATMNNLQTLHQSLEESLSGHKFLLVLDDVWDKDFGKWERLSICLKLGDPDARILVTTRKEEVARIMGTTPTNILKPRLISDLDCWLLMSQRAFQGRSNANIDELEDIGKEIAKKCKGLPLAAKTLGGMLMSKESVHEWKGILRSEIWELEQVKVELFPHIFLSYQELPSALKHCFLILAMFPKDTYLAVEDIVRIWMAHGFLNPRTKNDDMVEIGQKYLEFLLSRAFLEEKDPWILMHDIMHDFALHLSRNEFISIRVLDKIENDSGSMSSSERYSCLKSTTARHLYINGNIDIASISIGFDVEKLCTCIIRNVATNGISDLVKRIKMVRALYLVRCDLKQVPPSIENLIHLRLLNLSYNPLVELPETIGGLYNLQQLFLEGSRLSTLPDSMGELTNLIFLKPDDLVLKMAPESAGKLINLHNLGTIKVEAGKRKLSFLKNLNQLRGKLKIEFNSDYCDEVDAKKAAIERKKHITVLEFLFNDHEVTDGMIAALQPPSHIQDLRIHGLKPSCGLLPGWITSLNHLTELVVFRVENVSNLPPLGKLQSLKRLQIRRFTALKIIGREFLGIGNKPNKKCSAFPKLVELIFSGCNELTGWEDLKPEEDFINVMPNIEILMFQICDKFEDLPRRLLRHASSLKKLSLSKKCKDCSESFFDFGVEQMVEDVAGSLLLIQGDQRLEMFVEGRTKVPTSIIYHSYITLLDIYCAPQQISHLPPMGKLPYLQSLSISEFSRLQFIGRDFLGIDDPNNDEDFVAFPNLLKLEIVGCGFLQEWEDLKPEDEGKVTVMPKLQRLHIMFCPKLQVLPSQLLCRAASLEELKCNDNNDSLAENIMKDRKLLGHVKNVYVNKQQCSLHPSAKSDNENGSGSR